MPHIHNNPGEHDHTISAFIVRETEANPDRSPSLILHRHKLLDVWLQFGGHVELHEDPWDAVEHEVLEESGYSLNQLNILQPPGSKLMRLSPPGKLHPYPLYYLTHPFSHIDHFHTDIGFGFVTDQDPGDSVGHGESELVQLFDRTELAKLPESEIPANVREIGLFLLDTCLQDWARQPAVDFSTPKSPAGDS